MVFDFPGTGYVLALLVAFLPCAGCGASSSVPKHVLTNEPVAVDAGSASTTAMTSEPPPDLFAPSKPTRPLHVPASCVGAKLDYVTATNTCACVTKAVAAITKTPETLCDFEKGDTPDMDQLNIAAEIVAGPSANSPARIVVRFTNPSDRPLRVLLDRGHDTFEPTLIDERGKGIAAERDPACKEMDSVSEAHVALVVLEPGGTIEHALNWSVHRARRVPSPQGGCRTVAGAKLPKGKYTLEWSPSEVWALRTATLRVGYEVR